MASTYLQRVWALPVVALIASLLSPVAAQSNKIINDLAYILPIIVVAVAIILIAFVIYCVMRQARYGYFCCMKPRVIRLPDSPTPSEHSDREEEEEAESSTTPQGDQGESTTAPEYAPPLNSVIAPPDYQDALHDVLVVRGDGPAQPQLYATNEGGANGPASQSEEPEASSAAADGNHEEGVGHQQILEDVDLDDNSTESVDDTTPLNP